MFFINSIKHNRLILLVAFSLTTFYNWAFFKHVNEVYPIFEGNLGFTLSVALVSFCALALVLCVLCIRALTKPILILFTIVAAFAAYYMNVFDIVIDKIMIQNIMETSVKEATDLFTFKLVAYGLGLGVVPAYLIYTFKNTPLSWRKALASRMGLITLLILVVGSQALIYSKNYSSFLREQKSIRFYSNPLTPIYSFLGYFKPQKERGSLVVAPLGTDARVEQAAKQRNLVILVVGETARWDHFSLNGYNKPTNPLLAQEKIVNFKNFHSCGTSTAVSVPCMFTNLGRAGYSKDKFMASENLLDVLNRAGVHVLWRDNNSDSKGVADRVAYQDYKDNTLNTVCDIECRDEGMLVDLQEYIDQHPNGNITIVLHQMGSHGPAYFKRYPAAFEKFKPACQNNLLEKCTVEEINNAYDNTILYTDYFLAKTIGLLKKNSEQFQAALFYMGDHGESLGENGVYLHGMPYSIAPEAQTHVGAVMWLSGTFNGITTETLKAKESQTLSHDNLFHTILGMMNVQTSVYDINQDILKKP